jgi:hypothetical protein
MILKYKIHYKFYCVVYSIMIYLLYTNTRLGYHRVYVTREEIFSPVNRDEISHVIAKKQSLKWLYFAFRLIFNPLYATTVLHKSNSRLIGVLNAQTS